MKNISHTPFWCYKIMYENIFHRPEEAMLQTGESLSTEHKIGSDLKDINLIYVSLFQYYGFSCCLNMHMHYHNLALKILNLLWKVA